MGDDHHQDFGKYLGNLTMVSNMLDQLMHHGTIFEFEANRYWLMDKAEQLAICIETPDLAALLRENSYAAL